MSRTKTMALNNFRCFPRPRGDEPVTQAVARDVLGFSPPTRG